MSPDEQAQALELAEYVRIQQRALLPQGQSLSHCEDCGEEIPEARRKVMFVTRCIACQEELEIIKGESHEPRTSRVLGHIEGNSIWSSAEERMKDKIDSIDNRLRKVESRAAILGAGAGTVVSVGVALMIEQGKSTLGL